ncbi:hypothetical protein DFH05DRAFT_1456434 [Lentinula detonsa]|uniref:Uncharacterized protein n=1 Tax=Lentinula detonsa TaxID=2804962 RepID=A0A9W8P7F8_9AGAR|nr:hypothetical protein DFH05DRAFT_1456434 [Lentinula detonsa]
MPALHCPISINRPTPEERSVITQAARESTWGMRHPPKLPPPLPGWIRVKFYSHIYKIRHEMLPDMEGDVQLSRSGWLDLRVVCRIWNLEACTPIDPMRWVPVKPTRLFWLSPIAVRVLSEQNQCIMMIEPTPLSPSTVHKRELRDASFHLYTSFFMLFHLMYSVPITIAHTSVAFFRGRWTRWGRRSRFPMWIEHAIIPLIMLLSWFARKSKQPFNGAYAKRVNKSCKKKISIVMRSDEALWMQKQKNWIALVLCLLTLMLGGFLLLDMIGEVLYKVMSALRPYSTWGRAVVTRGLRNVRAIGRGT